MCFLLDKRGDRFCSAFFFVFFFCLGGVFSFFSFEMPPCTLHHSVARPASAVRSLLAPSTPEMEDTSVRAALHEGRKCPSDLPSTKGGVEGC